MSKVKDMTVGKPFPVIFTYFIPILLTTMCQQLYNIVDSMIVGKKIGDMALAAVGASGSISFFIFGFIMGLSGGMTVVIAQTFGAGNYAKLKKAITMGFVSCGFVAVVVMAVSLCSLRNILIYLKTDPIILDDAVLYMGLILAGIPLILLYNCLSSILNALGDSKTPMVGVLIASGVNIFLDLLFIVTFKMGVEGAAYGTLIAQVAAGSYCFVKVYRIDIARVKSSDWKLDFSLIKEQFRVGLPLAFMNSITAIGSIVLQYYVNVFGVNYLAAYSASMRIIDLAMNPCAAAGMTMSTYAGQNMGAGKIDRIKKGLLSSGAIAISVAVLLGGLIFAFPRFLAGMFLTDEQNIRLAVDFLKICGLMMWSISFLFLVRDTVQGMGFTVIPMASGVLELAMRVLAVVLFAKYIGFKSVALAEVMAWTGAFIMNGLYLMIKLKRLSAKKAPL